MRQQVINKDSPSDLQEIYSVRSGHLAHLRKVLHQWQELEPIVGAAAQFRLVIDSNVVIGDLLWLCGDRKNPDAQTSLMEVIEAETVQAYAPPELIVEVEEKIPSLAKEKGLSLEQMYEEWEKYKLKIKIRRPDPEKVEKLQSGVDPDDAFFIALAQTIGAIGVLSKDSHIRKMGGNQISVECIVSLRDYSRNLVISMNIKTNGVMLTGVVLAAIQKTFIGMRTLADSIARAPDWVKIVLLGGGLILVLHPEARAWAIRWIKDAMNGVKVVSTPIAEHIVQATALAQEHEQEAKAHMDEALKELKKHDS